MRSGPLAVLYFSIKRLPTQAQFQAYMKLAFLTISVFLGLLGEGCSSIGALDLLYWRQELVASFLFPGSPGEWPNYLQAVSASESDSAGNSPHGRKSQGPDGLVMDPARALEETAG